MAEKSDAATIPAHPPAPEKLRKLSRGVARETCTRRPALQDGELNLAISLCCCTPVKRDTRTKSNNKSEKTARPASRSRQTLRFHGDGTPHQPIVIALAPKNCRGQISDSDDSGFSAGSDS